MTGPEPRTAFPRILWLVILLGVLFSLGLFAAVLDRSIEQQRRAFFEETFYLAKEVERQMRQAPSIVADTVLLFSASQRVDADEFQRFVAPHLLGHRYLDSVSYLPRVPSVKTSKAASPLLRLRLNASPDKGLPAETLGFDRGFTALAPGQIIPPQLGSEALRNAVREAIDSGTTAISKPVVAAGGETTLYVVHALYGGPVPAVGSRRQRVSGLVLAVFKPLDLMVSQVAPSTLSIRFFLGSGKLVRWLGEEGRRAGLLLPHLHSDYYFGIGSTRWTLSMDRPLHWSDLDLRAPVFALLVGLALAAAGYGVVSGNIARTRLLLERNREVKRQVEERTQALRRKTAELECQKFALDQHSIVSITDTEGNITYANDRFCEVSQYSREDLLGKNHRIVKSGQHSREFFRELWVTIAGGEVWHGVICNRRKDGSHYWVNSTIVPFLGDDGRPYQYVSIRTDISAIKEAEAALHRRQIELQTILDSVPAMIRYQDRGNRILQVNGATARALGLAPADIVGRPAAELLPSTSAGGEDEAEVIRTGEPRLGIIEPIQVAGGETRWLSTDKVPYRDESGNIVGIIVFSLDITERLRAEEALRESELRLKRSQVFANIGTWDWNIRTGELFWSERIAPLFGYPEGELATSYDNFLAAIHPEDRQGVVDAVRACVEHGAPYEIEHRVVWQDRTIRWLLEQGDVERDKDGNPLRMLGVVQDITHRKEMERTLARQQALLDMLRQAMSGFLVSAQFDETARFMLERLLDITRSTWGTVAEVAADGSGVPVLQNPCELGKASAAGEGGDSFDPSGLIGEVLKSGKTVLRPPPGNAAPGASPTGGGDVMGFLGMPVFVGDELVGVLALAGRPDGYDEGLPRFLNPFTATFGALVAGKRMAQAQVRGREELLNAKEQAEAANRAKSRFLSSMSHELRTPLNAILGFSQLLAVDEEQPLTEDQLDQVQEIIKAGEHLLELINGILDLARVEAGRIELAMAQVPLAEVLDECAALIRPMAEERDITFVAGAVEGVGCSVWADRTRFKQVLLNLMSNGVKYNQKGGTLRVSCGPGDDGRIRIAVQDTGPGIPPEYRNELFQPFNRLGAENGVTDGAGIGLVITRQLVVAMGGVIGVESVPGEGSTFWFELPRSAPS